MAAQPYQQLVRQIVARWHDGDPPDASAALRQNAELQPVTFAVVALACEEFNLRRTRGESLDIREFSARFPACAGQIRDLLEFSRQDPRCTPSQWAELLESLRSESVRWPSVGERWEGLRIIEELGQGGFARVYLAEEMREGNRPVVVKVSMRAVGEAQLQGTLFHPHIVPVLTAATANDCDFQSFVMPFFGRRTVADLLANPPAADSAIRLDDPVAHARRVLRIGLDMVEALRHMHSRGCFHNDVKPANILLTQTGRALLFDFNLATKGQIRPGLGGTLPYMAPERLAWVGVAQFARTPPTANPIAAELFSLAAVLYQVLLGTLPFGEPPGELSDAEQAAWLVRRQLDGLILPERQSLHPAFQALLELLVPCLDCRVDRRWADAAEFAERGVWLLAQIDAGVAWDGLCERLAALPWRNAAPSRVVWREAKSAANSNPHSDKSHSDKSHSDKSHSDKSQSAKSQSARGQSAVGTRDAGASVRDAGTVALATPAIANGPVVAERRWWSPVRHPLAAVAVILGGLVGAALEEAAWTTESRPLTWDELSSRSRSWTERVGQWRTYWDPGDAEGWALLGDGRLARFEPDAAGACYANALRLGLDTAALRNNLGLALCLDGRLDQAESAFASALERDPDLHEARENRHSSRQTWEACEFLRQAPGAARDNRP